MKLTILYVVVGDTLLKNTNNKMINKTTNNWGASGSVAQVYNQLGGAGGGATYEADICSGTFAVSNIATDEVQFATFAESTTYWWAGAQNYFALSIRLGDV